MRGPGPLLEPMLMVWGRSWDQCWRSWAALGPLLAVLARAWGHCVRSWAALGAYVGGLGPLLEPMLAILGRSLRLCWWSWPLLGPMLAVLGGLEPKSGPNPNGKAEKWPKPEREQGPKGRGPAEAPRSIWCLYPFFLRICMLCIFFNKSITF